MPGMDELIDTHCHLNDPSFQDKLGEVLERAGRKGVARCVVPSYDRESLGRTLKMTRIYAGMIFPGFGIHPWYIEDGALQELEKYLRTPEAVCVGEVGLDFSPGMPPRELQESFFKTQLGMAADRSLPVAVHCRKAHDRAYEIVRNLRHPVTLIMHSFSGSVEMMKRFLDFGAYISFSGSVTRDTAKKYHRCAASVPLDRLLVETDAPSIATQTTRASEVEPMHTTEVARKIAEIRGVPYSEICTCSTSNARHAFGGRM